MMNSAVVVAAAAAAQAEIRESRLVEEEGEECLLSPA